MPTLRDLRLQRMPVEAPPPEPDLESVLVDATGASGRHAVQFELGRLETVGTTDALKYEPAAFVRIVVSKVIDGLSYLSDLEHRPPIRSLVETVLGPDALVDDRPVQQDPALVAELLRQRIDESYRRQEITYRSAGALVEKVVEDSWCFVPETFGKAFQLGDIAAWDPQSHDVMPITGWRRCVHESAAFDSGAEFRLAQILDGAADVTWWLRNRRGIVEIPTPIGRYIPDFLALVGTADGPSIFVFEAKGDYLWEEPDSDSRVKARAGAEFCKASNLAGTEPPWEYVLILESDLVECRTVIDVLSRAVDP